MTLSITTDDFLDVTDLAKVAGCDFAVWFSRSLSDWCQQSETGSGLWSKKQADSCALSPASLMTRYESAVPCN